MLSFTLTNIKSLDMKNNYVEHQNLSNFSKIKQNTMKIMSHKAFVKKTY